jgi:hypothetical protein
VYGLVTTPIMTRAFAEQPKPFDGETRSTLERYRSRNTIAH